MKQIIPLFIFILFACQQEVLLNSCDDTPLAVGNVVNQDEYEIINLIVDSMYLDIDFIHIVQESLTGESLAPASKIVREFGIIDSIDFDQLMLKNEELYKWKNRFLSPVKLIAEKEKQCFFEGNDVEMNWKSYYAKYSSSEGFLAFNRPLIKEDNTSIVMFEFYCGGLCGCGYLVNLEKGGSQWKIKNIVKIWIA